MADKCICLSCSSVIKGNQTSIECSACCGWAHKGCAGISTQDYNNILAQFKKTKSHNWECINCKKTVIKRLSFGVSSANTSADRPNQPTPLSLVNGSCNDDGHDNGASINFTASGALAAQKSEVQVKSQINNLLKKTNTTNKDVLSIISCVIDLLLEQKRGLELTLDEIRANQLAKDERIEILEAKIVDLQNNLKQQEQEKSEGQSCFTVDHNTNNDIKNIL